MQRRILLVDGERALKTALATALRQDGYEVELADSGDEALELAAHTPLDLVVTDLRLPAMDGLDLFRRLRERQPGLAGVVVTAYGSLESAVEALRLGFADYVTKPFEVAALRRLVGRVLAASRPSGGAVDPFARAAVPHELLAAPGEGRWVHDLWQVGAGRRGVLLAAEPGAGRGVMRALFRAEAAHCARPRAVVERVAQWLGERLVAFFGVVDMAGRVLRFATRGGMVARLCGADLGTDALSGRHDDLGLAIDAADRLVVGSPDAAAADPEAGLGEAQALRAGALLRVDVGSVVRSLEEDTLTLRPPCSAEACIARTEEVAARAGLEATDTFRVVTAVAEAVHNAECHGYGGRDEGRIEVRYLQTPRDLLIQVRDSGCGFDAEAAEPALVGPGDLYRESGRGFLVMRRLMDAVDVESALGQGTTVRMEKGVGSPRLA